MNFISSPFTDNIEKKNYIESGCIYNSAQNKIAQYSKCFLSSDNVVYIVDVHSLTAKELKYIPKIILLREFNYINQLWDRLPDHIKADSEVQQQRCLKYYNLPCY